MNSQLTILCFLILISVLNVSAQAPSGMRRVAAGTFWVGSTDPHANASEQPRHRVKLNAFWIDTTEVTNSDFARFVAATGYVTIAERPVNWEELKKQVAPGTPKPPDSMLAPGSLVFIVPKQGTPMNDVSLWWRWQLGASWKHPEGAASNINNRMNHPVVHIAYDDAAAYAAWANKRLPTEAEWEVAALGGKSGAIYPWGSRAPTDNDSVANIWQGIFPWKNDEHDGYLRTSPVASYQRNEYGLYDMGGNVWEWCSDQFRADAYEMLADSLGKRVAVSPQGPTTSWDPDEQISSITKHVIRGGSFLCHASYCESYRVSARRGESPDTGMSHIGFRCVRD